MMFGIIHGLVLNNFTLSTLHSHQSVFQIIAQDMTSITAQFLVLYRSSNKANLYLLNPF